MESKSINPELMFQEFFNNMNYCALLYEAIDNGENFILKAVNNVGERKKIPKINKLNSSQLNEKNPENFDYNFFNHMKKVWKSGNPVSITIETRASNNNPLHSSEFFIFKIYSNYIAAIFNEITPYKFTENIKKDSKILYKYIMDNLNDLIGILDSDFKYCYVNKSYEKILGYSQDNLIGTHPIGHVHPDDFELAMKTTYLGIKSGKAKADVRYLNKNGEELWYELNGTYFTDIYGNKKSLLISRGINDRKVAELNIRESEENYRILFERYEMLLESITDAVFVINRDWVYTLVNKSAEKMIHIPVEKYIGHKVIDVFPNIEQTSFFKTYENVMNTGEPDRIVDNFTLPDGRTEYYEVSVYPINEGILCIGRDITEEEMVKQKLRESEEKFRTIAEQSLMGICITQDNRMKYINKTFADIFGYTVEEMMNWTIEDMKNAIYSDNLEFILTQFKKKQVGDNDIILNYQYRGVKKNGDVVWIDNYSKPIIYEDNYADLVTIVDITDKIKAMQERKSAEEKSKRSEEDYRMIFNQSPDYIFITDSKGYLLNANPVLLEKLNLSLYDIQGKNVIDFFAGDNYDKVIETFKSVRKGIEVKNLEISIQNKDGELFDLEVNAVPIKKNENEINILNIARDITEKKLAEKALQENKLLFERTLNSLKEAVFILDTEIPPKILYFNPAAEKIFGYSRKEFNGQSMELLHIDNTSLKKFQQIIFSKIEEKGFVGDFEFHMKRKDGSIFPAELSINTLENENVERIGWISIVRDITEREKTEEKSKELDIIKADFVYRASHELKTPLTSIYSASQLLLMNFENLNKNQIHEFIQIIHQGGKRLKALITDLLDISKIESKNLQISKKKEDIIKLLNQSIYEIKFEALNKKISLNLNFPNEFYISIDKSKIGQLFLNILSNAVNYTPPKGEVFVNFRNLEELIEIEVKDTGIGFTDYEKKLIFKKFGKIERYGKGLNIITEGSGLGLYISQEIARIHGGNIKVESEGRNKGSSFYITLPKN